MSPTQSSRTESGSLLDEARHVSESMAERTAWRTCRDNAAGPRSANAAAGTPWPRLACPRGSGAPRVRRRCPESALASDITEHKTSEDKLYLRAIKNVISNRIVGYLISDRMKARLAEY